jgi:GNAT superfamily N-acetyltransferase
MSTLSKKLDEFKEKYPSKKNVSLNDLKAVYRRGSGAYSQSHRPTITGGKPNSRAAWSFARVNKFLEKAAGKKVKAAYVQDDDLLKYEGGGNVEKLIEQGVVDLKFYKTTIEHANIYGFESNKPLYVQRIFVNENDRNKGIGRDVLQYLCEYAKENNNDLIFGHIEQKSEPSIDVIKSLLQKNGYITIEGNNDFYKYIDTNASSSFEDGGFVDGKMELYHGGNLDEYNDVIAQKSGRYEYGAGLYLTTHQDTARKYAKGSRRLYKITITEGVDINDATISTDNINAFIKKYVISSKRKEISERLEKWNDNGKVKAYIFNNVILNEKGISPSNTKYLRIFLVENGIDYEIVDNPFGWGETMVVLYNMAKIVDVEKLDKSKYADGGEVLLAPNGKPSNLTPEQYKLVRTPEFKVWFGDWENDPKNSSKVVDENGEPLVVYHGTNYEFNSFEPSKTNFYAITIGTYFFTDKKEVARNFGKNILSVFLLIDNPTYLDGRSSGRFNTWDLYDDEGNYGFIVSNSDTGGGIATEYAVENSTQIKLADGTNTTFDGSNPDIRYEEGGEVKQKEEDIFKDIYRYKYDGFFSNFNESELQSITDFLFGVMRRTDSGLSEGISKKTLRNLFFNTPQSFRELYEVKPNKNLWRGDVSLPRKKDSKTNYYLQSYSTKSMASFFGNEIWCSTAIASYNGSFSTLKYNANLKQSDYWFLKAMTFYLLSKKDNKQYSELFNMQQFFSIFYTLNGKGLLGRKHENWLKKKLLSKGLDFSEDKYKYGDEIEIGDDEGEVMFFDVTYNYNKLTDETKRYDDGGLIAPNGKPSNLTPEQYKLVRTPEFKVWFGDWENDPKNASKVIDENGEPLVVYHYSNKDFNIFRNNGFIETLSGAVKNYGVYFANDYNSREFYFKNKGNYEYECFIRLINPFYNDNYRWSQIINEERFSFLKENNFDGIITNGSLNEYIVLKSNQIKLADGTNTTFDANSDDIRYEEGGVVAEYIKNIEVIGDDEEGILYSGRYGNSGVLSWINYGEVINVITIESGNKKGSSGTMAIASLFLLNPKVQTITYQDNSHFEDGTSFWVRIGGDYTDLERSNFFNYFQNKFGYNPDIRYVDGGTTITKFKNEEMEQMIQCVQCDWTWSTADSDEADKYVCHKCGFDNSLFYDTDILKPTLTIQEIAEKHNVEIDYVIDQLVKGTEHEMEHTDIMEVAKKIALHHVAETPDYYEKLDKMELEDGGETEEVILEDNSLVEIEIIEYLKQQMAEAEEVMHCNDSRIFKTMICKTKIEIAEKRLFETENPEEQNVWNECILIWSGTMKDIFENNIPVREYKDGGTPCGCGSMYEKGGLAYGNSHDKGGMPLEVSSTGQKIEIEGGEGVVNKRSMQITKKLEFEGKKYTPCEVVSKINEMGGGVKFKCSDVNEIIAEDGHF